MILVLNSENMKREELEIVVEQIFPPPQFSDEDKDEKTNTSVTVIQSKNRSSALAEDEESKSLSCTVACVTRNIESPLITGKIFTSSSLRTRCYNH